VDLKFLLFESQDFAVCQLCYCMLKAGLNAGFSTALYFMDKKRQL